MYDGAVLVVDAEEAAALIAEFDVDGRQFATSLLRDGDVVLELDPSPERSSSRQPSERTVTRSRWRRLESY